MQFKTVSAAAGPYDAALRVLPAGAPVRFCDQALQAAWQAHLGGDPLTLEHRQVLTLRLPLLGGFTTLLLAGFDAGVPAPMDAFRSLWARLGALLAECRASNVFLDALNEFSFASEAELLAQACAVLPLCEYTFDRYRTEKDPRREHTVSVLADGALAPVLAEGASLAGAVMTARDLVNDIAETLTPAELARRCRDLGACHGFSVEVLDRAQCQALGMGLFLAVARGSALEPQFIVMRYRGGGAQPPIALVGKGITYDSGGLALKGSGMELMRYDMNGAAAVIGAMCAVADNALPRNVVAVVAACENMVDARSYRNGDVFPSMSGKTVYVRNTDAEGRLTMADAITYCVRKESPSEILEVAGLTGSVCNFYGKVCAAALTTDPALFDPVPLHQGKGDGRMSAQARLKELGLTLPQAPQPKGSYCTWRQAGEWITLSGQGPLVEGVLRYTGRVGVDLTVEQGYDAARLSALNLLAVLRQAAGGLERVELVRVLGFIAAGPDFADYPGVLNGASDLFLSVLGVRGRHSRSAVGVYGLPFGLPVEVELTARLLPAAD